VQLCASNATTFVLWNLAAKRTQQVFHIEGQRLWDEAPKRKGPVLAITPDCSLVAGAATTLDDTGVFAVWDSVSSRPLFHGEQLTTALAFSPDGQFLATGAEDGAVQVFTREGLLLATNNFSHTAVRSLAFQKTVVRSPRSTGPLENWLLAVGEAASTVRLWYLGEAQPPGLLRGCENDVEAVAFNRDGTFLAAASHGGVRLFDVATEKMVLVLPAVDLTFALAFAPSGVGLASGGDNRSKPGAAIFHRLERDRGIQILHGLEGVVEQLRVSRDGRSLVALAQNWRIAVWNRMDGTLQHTMDAPRGVYADNAALALSSNGSLLAVSAGTNAILWNLSTGHEELRRQLPHGLSEQLIFFGTNKLMLFRLERKDALGRPKSQHALGWPSQHCCIRDLLATNRPTPVTSFAEFNWGLNLSAAAPDGRYFVADGMCVKDGATNRSLEFFDGATGSWAGRIPMKLVLDGRGEPYFGLGSFDPTGEFLLCRLAGGLETTLFRASTLRGVRSFGHSLHALAPTATSWAEIGGADLPSLCGLFEASQVKPVLTFAVDLTGAYMKSLQFDLTGRFLAWCNNDGTVSVCDVPTTKRRLAELGLGN
jgi:WD40 repeat protein